VAEIPGPSTLRRRVRRRVPVDPSDPGPWCALLISVLTAWQAGSRVLRWRTGTKPSAPAPVREHQGDVDPNLKEASVASTEWVCPAYGAGGQEVGAVCFFAGALGERVCPSASTCATQLAAERVRLHQVIQAGAAAGDLAMQLLALEFPTPEKLLGGGQASDDG